MRYLSLFFWNLPHVFLNPIVFFAYILIATSREDWGAIVRVPEEVNVSRMIPGYYLAFAVAAALIWLAVVVAGQFLFARAQTHAWPETAGVVLNHLSGVGLRGRHLLTWVGFIGTAIVVKVWIDGMEGNIAGFFGMPIMLAAIVCYLIGTYGTWGISEPIIKFFARFAPLRLVEGRGLWAEFATLAIFSPMILYSAFKGVESGQIKADAGGVFGFVVMGLIYYAFCLVLNCGLLKLNGVGASWGAIVSTYFKQARDLRSLEQLGAILILALAFVRFAPLRLCVVLTSYALIFIQIYGGIKAFNGTRAALSTPPPTVTRP